MAIAPPPPTQSKAVVFARRSVSTIALWLLVTAIFTSRQSWAVLALILVLGLVASVEYFRMLRAAGVKCHPRAGLLLAVAYSAAVFWIFQSGGREVPADIDAAGIFLAVAIPFALQLRHAVRGPDAITAVAVNLLGFGYVTILFSFTARLTFMAPVAGSVAGHVSTAGALLLLWLLAVTKFTDMGAYIIGSMIGRHKMIPHISPGKTWEGFGGALLFSQIAGCGLYAWFPEEFAIFKSWGHVVTLGVILAVLAVIGDLAESILKRALGAKDSGKMLPGIGGSLDLIDSLCFTAPALYFYLKWVLLPAA